ncbi:cytochrome b2 [Ophiostoma piceae UAMH 11346]|uniref:Cytochrome b2 n=1 Tax=Ophiostoma piceae (strain UAMH 11346) TaxID=1262450 RepID=S3C7V7_OPHP1|nr:cytochrome b2 [Ophiostoma piceae UAMH 11346]
MASPPKPLPLSACMSLDDLAEVAASKLSPRAAAYYHSGAETLFTRNRNRADWARIGFRPRVLLDVAATPNMRANIMGFDSSLPVFIAPAASAGLGHPDGELCLSRGAGRMDIAQCVCTYASVAPKSIMADFKTDAQRRGGTLFFQLYVPKVKKNAAKLIAMAKENGFEALVITVDSPVIGKRDDDDRFRALDKRKPGDDEPPFELPDLPGKEPGTLRGSHNPSFTWSDLQWIRELWGDEKPIIIKGISTAEDALEATRVPGVRIDGIYLSNHGGRQLDYAPTAVQALLDIRARAPEVFAKTAVYVDGGIMRGTDVVKALCLGARGVGIGRGFLYSLSAFGTNGVLKAIKILSEEIQTTLRLLGVSDIAELDERHLNLTEFGITRPRL